MNVIINIFFYAFLLLFNFFSKTQCDFDQFEKEDHNKDELDNYEYDHHVILGSDQTAIFDKLSPEESKARLGDIIDKMDLNADGKIDMFELKSWIKNVFDTLLNDNVNAQWKDIVKDNAEKIDFETYLRNAYKRGITEDHTELVNKEKRRWTYADLDKDNYLNKTELFRFLHPEEFNDLHPLLAQESLEELDLNHDGLLDIDEYLKDSFPEGREVKEEWVRHERETFGSTRDENKDGYLDVKEVQKWLLPESYDRVEAEADHLMDKANAGSDKILTKAEMLEKYKVFVGSRDDGPDSHYMNHDDL